MPNLRWAELFISLSTVLGLVILLGPHGGQFPIVRSPLQSSTRSERLMDVQSLPVTRRIVKHMLLH